jgi:hypothetical protein
LPIASSRAQAIRAIPPVALGIELISSDLTNRMTEASWSVAGPRRQPTDGWRALQDAG